MAHNDSYWKRKRVQQLKKKIRAARSVLRDCAQKSDSFSDMYRKASSQLANFQTQLDALTQGTGDGLVVPVRPPRHDRITVESLGGFMVPDTPTPASRRARCMSDAGGLSESLGLSSSEREEETSRSAPSTPLSLPVDSMSDVSDGPPDLLSVASPASPPGLSFARYESGLPQLPLL